MRLLLKEAVDALGEPGDEVNVSAGFARNYLLPKRLALHPTEENRRVVGQARAEWEVHCRKELAAAQSLGATLGGRVLEFERQPKTDSSELYGSVSVSDIARRLGEDGVELQKNRIILGHSIKELGESPVRIRLHPEVEIEVTVVVSAPGGEEPAPPSAAAEEPSEAGPDSDGASSEAT